MWRSMDVSREAIHMLPANILFGSVNSGSALIVLPVVFANLCVFSPAPDAIDVRARYKDRPISTPNVQVPDISNVVDGSRYKIVHPQKPVVPDALCSSSSFTSSRLTVRQGVVTPDKCSVQDVDSDR